MRIRDVMHERPACCSQSDSLEVPARFMREHDCGAIPVLDAQGRAASMITDRDIALAALTEGRPLAEIRVRSAMSPALYLVHPDDDIRQAERVMSRHQVRRLPVVEHGGEVVGVVSLADLALHADKTNEHKDLNRDGVGAVLTAISEPEPMHRARPDNLH
jgi:CBS domain-containing protein